MRAFRGFAPNHGVRIPTLGAEQQKLFEKLWNTWHGAFAGKLGTRPIPMETTFSWRGSLDADRPHYYRIQSLSTVIEFSWQGNHVHSVIRHRTREFGTGLLK